jgi:hypothetical protein
LQPDPPSEALAEVGAMPPVAERASDRQELMRVVNMMGDTNVETVRRHYFNLEYDDDDDRRRELPNYAATASGGGSAAFDQKLRTNRVTTHQRIELFGLRLEASSLQNSYGRSYSRCWYVSHL